MKKRISLFAVALIAIQCTSATCADVSPLNNPTSADNIRFSYRRTCSSYLPYKANPYQVSMAQNNITVQLGDIVPQIVVCPGPVPPFEEFDVGRLPAGNYTLTLIGSANYVPNLILIDHAPFTVTDARTTKRAPYARRDYSGHWWDPNDSGWGLFIWQGGSADVVLAAWFTYTPDGKPMWYVFQSTFETSTSTLIADLLQTSRAPGSTSPPPAPTAYNVVGSASLDFTNFGSGDDGKPDAGKLTYTFGNGAKLVRNIQRFNP